MRPGREGNTEMISWGVLMILRPCISKIWNLRSPIPARRRAAWASAPARRAGLLTLFPSGDAKNLLKWK